MSGSMRMSFGRFDYAAFLTFFAYAAGSVVIPVVLVTLAHDLRFPLESGGMTAGGVLHLGRSLPMVVSMLLCGFMAGWWGKRRTLGWSVLLMATGMGLCAISPGYGILLLALILAGCGEGVIEGLATPFVEKLHPAEPGRYINFTHAFWSVGVVATVLLAGALLSLGVPWRFLVGGVAALTMIPVLLLLLPARRGRDYPDHHEPLHWTVVGGHATRIMRSPRFWLFFAAMFFAGGGEFCLTFWCASYIQLHFSSAAWAGGVGTACFAGGMVLGRTGWGYLLHQRHLKGLILFSSLGGVLVTIALPLQSSLWIFFCLLFLSGIATAPFWPSVQSYCVDRLPGTDSTMVYILLSCAGVPGCGVFTWLMGYMGDRAGDLCGAFYLVPLCFLLLGLLVIVEGILPAAEKNGT